MSDSSAVSLSVNRTDFGSALRVLKAPGRNSEEMVALAFQEGWLDLSTATTSTRLPAAGVWPQTVYLAMSWVDTLRKKLPDGDPIYLRIENERIHVARYSHSFRTTLPVAPTQGHGGPIPQTVIDRAAETLSPLHISPAQVKELIDKAASKKDIPWREEDARVTARIAKAWVVLAPYGVEPEDIRRSMVEALRSAWKAPK